MVFEFWPEVAPETVKNFKKLAKTGYFDGQVRWNAFIFCCLMLIDGDNLVKVAVRVSVVTTVIGFVLRVSYSDNEGALAGLPPHHQGLRHPGELLRGHLALPQHIGLHTRNICNAFITARVATQTLRSAMARRELSRARMEARCGPGAPAGPDTTSRRSSTSASTSSACSPWRAVPIRIRPGRSSSCAWGL